MQLNFMEGSGSAFFVKILMRIFFKNGHFFYVQKLFFIEKFPQKKRFTASCCKNSATADFFDCIIFYFLTYVILGVFFCKYDILTNDLQKNAKKRQIFLCETCDFKCSKQSEYDRHLSTRKHQILTNTYKKKRQKTPQHFAVNVEIYINIVKA